MTNGNFIGFYSTTQIANNKAIQEQPDNSIKSRLDIEKTDLMGWIENTNSILPRLNLKVLAKMIEVSLQSGRYTDSYLEEPKLKEK